MSQTIKLGVIVGNQERAELFCGVIDVDFKVLTDKESLVIAFNPKHKAEALKWLRKTHKLMRSVDVNKNIDVEPIEEPSRIITL